MQKNSGLLAVCICMLFLMVGCNAKPAGEKDLTVNKTESEAETKSAPEKELPPPTREEIGAAFGVIMAMYLKDSKLDVDYNKFVQELKKTLKKDTVDPAAAQQVLQRASEVARKKELETNHKAETEFLEKNAKAEGVVTTESGLQYKIIREGTGTKPAATDTVKVHYKGTLLDGTVFDSSYDRGEPVEFPLNGVIHGWTEGLQLMAVGSKYQLFIPSKIGYGERGAGRAIPPNALLTFEVELLEIVKPAADASAQSATK